MSSFVVSTETQEEKKISFVPVDNDLDVSQLKDKYLVIGVPSESGLGQIAVEAMYHALLPSGAIRRIGYLKSHFLTPIAGYAHEGNGETALIHPAEVFYHPEQGIVFILLRSAVLPNAELAFAQHFLHFLACFFAPKATLFLTGASREQWDINPYQTHHLLNIVNEHSKARIESHFPGLFALYDGSDSVTVRLPSLADFTHPVCDTPDCTSPSLPSCVSPQNNTDNNNNNNNNDSLNNSVVQEYAVMFLKRPNHVLNNSDVTFPLGMSLSVAFLYTLYFHQYLRHTCDTNDSRHSRDTGTHQDTSVPTDALRNLREMSAVYGVFETVMGHNATPLRHGLVWAEELLVALRLLPSSKNETAAGSADSESETVATALRHEAQQLLRENIPLLWREILMESM